jgi:hypothetical protein
VARRIRDLLDGRTLFISVITEIELLSIPFQSHADERLMRDFISNGHSRFLDRFDGLMISAQFIVAFSEIF